MVGTCGKTTRNKPRVMVERRGEKAYCRKDGETRLKRMHGSEKVQTLRKRRKNKKNSLWCVPGLFKARPWWTSLWRENERQLPHLRSRLPAFRRTYSIHQHNKHWAHNSTLLLEITWGFTWTNTWFKKQNKTRLWNLSKERLGIYSNLILRFW